MIRIKAYWTASAVVALVAVGYVGFVYSTIRSADHHLVLIGLLAQSDTDWLGSRIARYELKRRIATGEFDGVEVLSDLLVVSSTDESVQDIMLEEADSLLNGSVDINSYSYAGLTPLQIAIINNDPEAVQYLIGRGADPEKVTSVGQNPLQFNAIELVYFLQQEFPKQDRTQMIEVLQSAHTGT